MKICSLYGAGFYYIPGTDTCIKVGGFVRAEVNVNAGGSFSVQQAGVVNGPESALAETWRTRAGVTIDTRSQTEYGTLRAYFIMATTETNGQVGGGNAANGLTPGNPGGTGLAPYTRLWSNAAFIQFAGFTAGKTASFFDFDLTSYSNQTNFWGSNMGGGGIDVFAYTAQFGNGLSASISVEDPNSRRMSITNGVAPLPAGSTPWAYGNLNVPDLVGNLRIDQAWGSAQVMGAYHEVRGAQFTATGSSDDNAAGWAVGAGIKVNLPMLGKGDYAIAQVTYGKGATVYVGSGINGGFTATNDAGTQFYLGPDTDAVRTANGYELTTGWSITGGYEHFWNTQWKTSIYGAYGELNYSDAASNVLRPAIAAAGSSANWDYWQVGSRTTWTPVANLDLSVEAMYNHLDAAWGGVTPAAAAAGLSISNRDWVSGIFRVQRNFYP